MSDHLERVLERGVYGFEPSPVALETTIRRVDTRRRRRRVAAAAVAVVVVVAAFALSAFVLRNAERSTPGTQPPAPAVEISAGRDITSPTIVSLDQAVLSHVQAAPAGAVDFDIASDGDRVAFVTSDGRVATMSIGGSDVRYLTDGSTRARDPEWSFAGDRIAFSVDRPGGGIFVVSASGGAVEEMNGWGYEPSWLGRDDWGLTFHSKHSISNLYALSLRQGASHAPHSLAPYGGMRVGFDSAVFSDAANGHDVVGLYSWYNLHDAVWLVRESCACTGSVTQTFSELGGQAESKRPNRTLDRLTPLKIVLSPAMTELAISERCEGENAGTGVIALDLVTPGNGIPYADPRWLVSCTPGVDVGLGSFTPDGTGLLVYREP